MLDAVKIVQFSNMLNSAGSIAIFKVGTKRLPVSVASRKEAIFDQGKFKGSACIIIIL
jgi:hypothetical protein